MLIYAGMLKPEENIDLNWLVKYQIRQIYISVAHLVLRVYNVYFWEWSAFYSPFLLCCNRIVCMLCYLLSNLTTYIHIYNYTQFDFLAYLKLKPTIKLLLIEIQLNLWRNKTESQKHQQHISQLSYKIDIQCLTFFMIYTVQFAGDYGR